MRLNLSRRLILASAALWIVAIAGCARKQVVVDDAALRAADGDAANWITYGRTYSEQRFSPLKLIDEQSVGKLGLAWSYDLETLRGVEATPLVKDGVIYTTSAWSLVYAFDAPTGKLLWQYDPKVPKDHAKYVCCDVVNRGVALYKGRVYVGTLDGRLIALDAKTGAPAYQVIYYIAGPDLAKLTEFSQKALSQMRRRRLVAASIRIKDGRSHTGCACCSTARS
jgi:quinohemoprotein ethanol dehydrogenase